MEFPKEIFQNILSYVPVISQEFKEFVTKVTLATRKGKKLKFPRFERNLRYDLFGLHSYGIRIADICFENN